MKKVVAVLIALALPFAARGDSLGPPPDEKHRVVAPGQELHLLGPEERLLVPPEGGVYMSLSLAKYDLDVRNYQNAELKACQDIATENASTGIRPWVIAGGIGIVAGIVLGVVFSVKYVK